MTADRHMPVPARKAFQPDTGRVMRTAHAFLALPDYHFSMSGIDIVQSCGNLSLVLSESVQMARLGLPDLQQER